MKIKVRRTMATISGVEKAPWGTTADGLAVDCYTLRNACGAMARIITYGATVTELWMPDRQGCCEDIVLGFDDLLPYETQSPYFGCIVGRVAFRIAGGEFSLDGETHQLSRNDGPHHMHGGIRSFSRCVWQAEPISQTDGAAVRFTLHRPDGDEGYPGAMDVAVVYTLTDDNQLRIEYSASTDRPTLANLTHHSYFNLAGAGCGDVLGHVLQLDADRWIPAEEPDLPSGDVAMVDRTPYDFRKPTPIGSRIQKTNPKTRGYDLCYLHNHADGALARVATLYEPENGRMMEVLTTEPAIVLYTGNYLDGSLQGKQGAAYGKHAGVCLETGRPPDAVHHPHFPSTTLRPGQDYRHTCIYRFSAK